jgi:hypothetical protein
VGVDVAPPTGHLVLQANNGVDHGHIPVALKVSIANADARRITPIELVDTASPNIERLNRSKVQTVQISEPFQSFQSFHRFAPFQLFSGYLTLLAPACLCRS